MQQDFRPELDGYAGIAKEIETARKYGSDYTEERGRISRIIDRLHPSEIKLRVIEVIKETPTVSTLRMVGENRYLPPFQAGQYITLYLETGGIRTARPYSLSSPPNQTGFYDVTVKRIENGRISNYLLDEVKPGHILTGSGPSGAFVFNPVIYPRTSVCVAGGSGITPFMSMIREVVQRGLDRVVYLFYGNRSMDDIIFHEELLHISSVHDKIIYTPVIEYPTPEYTGIKGLITEPVIQDVIGSTGEKVFFLCGPQGLYDFCLPVLENMGIPRKRLRREMYGAPSNIWDFPGWPDDVDKDDVFTVTVNGEKSVDATAAEPLINALENERIDVPCLCRAGTCSMCRVKILSGRVYEPPEVPVRQSDRKFGYIHSCMAYPISDLEVLI